MSAKPDIITAAVLVIGDEILSGRTKDKNIGYIADYLAAIGIDLKEVRVVADEAAAIIDALNALRTEYTYVFTTGGIGPTHDAVDPARAAARVLRMIRDQAVATTAGRDIPVKATTVCVHSDTPSAVAIAAELARVLRQPSARP